MAAGYILIAFTVVFLNIDMVPTVTKLIINSAFGLDAGYGAIIGMAVAWGVKRGVYSNEAGRAVALIQRRRQKSLIPPSRVWCRPFRSMWTRF